MEGSAAFAGNRWRGSAARKAPSSAIPIWSPLPRRSAFTALGSNVRPTSARPWAKRSSQRNLSLWTSPWITETIRSFLREHELKQLFAASPSRSLTPPRRPALATPSATDHQNPGDASSDDDCRRQTDGKVRRRGQNDDWRVLDRDHRQKRRVRG